MKELVAGQLSALPAGGHRIFYEAEIGRRISMPAISCPLCQVLLVEFFSLELNLRLFPLQCLILFFDVAILWQILESSNRVVF